MDGVVVLPAAGCVTSAPKMMVGCSNLGSISATARAGNRRF
jgi:hypothetical protein